MRVHVGPLRRRLVVDRAELEALGLVRVSNGTLWFRTGDARAGRLPALHAESGATAVSGDRLVTVGPRPAGAEPWTWQSGRSRQ